MATDKPSRPMLPEVASASPNRLRQSSISSSTSSRASDTSPISPMAWMKAGANSTESPKHDGAHHLGPSNPHSSLLPTPPSTGNLNSGRLPSPSPPKARSNTLPHPLTTKSLTAKALLLASASGGFLGPQRELRTGKAVVGVPDESAALVGAVMPERRQTDPGGVVNVEAAKDIFVRNLVEASVIAIESIWGVQDPDSDESVLPLNYFGMLFCASMSSFPAHLPYCLHLEVREVLRRSRTSCSTLQVALYYLHKLRREFRAAVSSAVEKKSRIRRELSSDEADSYPSPPPSPTDVEVSPPSDPALSCPQNPLLCGRRMFLSALLCASKYLQDRNYSNRAWSKIAGLPVEEINANERLFLLQIKYDLFLGADDFKKWTERLTALNVPQSQVPMITPSATREAAPSATRQTLERTTSNYAPAPPLSEMRSADPHGTPSAAAVLTRPTLQRSTLGRASSYPELTGRKPDSMMPKLRTSVPPHRSCLSEVYAPSSYGLVSPPLTDEECSPTSSKSGHPIFPPLLIRPSPRAEWV